MSFANWKKQEKKNNPLYSLRKRHSQLQAQVGISPEVTEGLAKVRKDFEEKKDNLRKTFNSDITKIIEQSIEAEIKVMEDKLNGNT